MLRGSELAQYVTYENIKVFIFFPLVSYGLVFVIRAWILDLKFYKANGWDFTKDSGRSMFPGVNLRIRGMAAIPHWQRVKIGYPVIVSVVALSWIVAGFELWRIFNG